MSADALWSRARAGDRAALSKALSAVEHATVEGRNLASETSSAEPWIVGWTGSPGAGKSSLIAASLVRWKDEPRCAVLAVDPTSPLSGGSVLGDRIRMDDLALDERVYIRSLPTRRKEGSLALATLRIARLLAAAGYADVHVETVGAGQGEMEIAELAETTVVVVSPHSGDSIQGLKAGLLEVADVLVVSKGDLDGARAAASNLETAVSEHADGWTPRIVITSARTGEGLDDLRDILIQHRRFLAENGRDTALRMRRRGAEFASLVKSELSARVEASAGFRRIREQVLAGALSPVEAAQNLASAWSEAK